VRVSRLWKLPQNPVPRIALALDPRSATHISKVILLNFNDFIGVLFKQIKHQLPKSKTKNQNSQFKNTKRNSKFKKSNPKIKIKTQKTNLKPKYKTKKYNTKIKKVQIQKLHPKKVKYRNKNTKS